MAASGQLVLHPAVADWLVSRGVVERGSVLPLGGDTVALDEQTSARFEAGAVRVGCIIRHSQLTAVDARLAPRTRARACLALPHAVLGLSAARSGRACSRIAAAPSQVAEAWAPIHRLLPSCLPPCLAARPWRRSRTAPQRWRACTTGASLCRRWRRAASTSTPTHALAL